MNSIIRPFQASDAHSLSRIHQQICVDSKLLPRYFQQQAEWVVGVNGRFLTLIHHTQPIGYASAFPMPGLPQLYELTGFVAPAYQRRGFGTRLFTHLCQSLRGTNARHLTSVLHPQTATAHFLRQQQFFVEHEEWQMTLANLQAQPLRATSQPLLPLSSIQFCKLYDNSFSHTAWYQPFTAIEVLSTRHESDTLLYVEVDKTAVGFVWLRYPTAKIAEIEPIGIIKSEQGKGYGRLLLQQTLYQLQQQDIQQVRLGVWANNPIAIHLYQQFGFCHQNTTTHLMFNLI